jgi:hypothetical protein
MYKYNHRGSDWGMREYNTPRTEFTYDSVKYSLSKGIRNDFISDAQKKSKNSPSPGSYSSLPKWVHPSGRFRSEPRNSEVDVIIKKEKK